MLYDWCASYLRGVSQNSNDQIEQVNIFSSLSIRIPCSELAICSFELMLITLIGLLLAFTTVYLYIGVPTEKLCLAQLWVPLIAFPLVTG